jgi:hypothetical protein
MTFESGPDTDFIVGDDTEAPVSLKSKEHIVAPRIVLKIPLPQLKEPADPDDPAADIGERMNDWTRDFKRAAECFLVEQGYANVKVDDFESLRYTDGYDEDDYILNVRIGTGGDGKVGGEGITTVPIIVRRVPKKGL